LIGFYNLRRKNMLEKLENGKDKTMGKIKETAGQLMGSEELKYHGKLQSMKADVSDKTEDVKDTVYEKANDMMDRLKSWKKDH
jgi:uncharacterized protein YjbJ (UPF0337 family)